MKKYYIYICIFIISCRTEIESPPDMGYRLAPLILASELVYNVDSIVYDDFKLRSDNKPDSFSFQVKEVFTDPFTDASGKIAYRIYMYRRLNDSFSWESYRVAQASKDNEGYQRTEDNYRYLRLVFPVQLNKTWNGNIYNLKNPVSYKYTQLYHPARIGKITYDSLVTVLQEKDSNFIEKRYFQEIYRPSIGLVYGQYDSINYQGSYSQTTQQYYWKGLLLRKTLLSHIP